MFCVQLRKSYIYTIYSSGTVRVNDERPFTYFLSDVIHTWHLTLYTYIYMIHVPILCSNTHKLLNAFKSFKHDRDTQLVTSPHLRQNSPNKQFILLSSGHLGDQISKGLFWEISQTFHERNLYKHDAYMRRCVRTTQQPRFHKTPSTEYLPAALLLYSHMSAQNINNPIIIYYIITAVPFTYTGYFIIIKVWRPQRIQLQNFRNEQ